MDHVYHICLRGTADGIFRRPVGGYLIVDYKNAPFTGTQDELLPVYRVQLNVYARIAEGCGLGPFTDLILIYMEPAVGGLESTGCGCRDYGFDMVFTARILSVDLRPESIDPLPARARELADLPSAPPGLTACDHCIRLESLTHHRITALGGINLPIKNPRDKKEGLLEQNGEQKSWFVITHEANRCTTT